MFHQTPISNHNYNPENYAVISIRIFIYYILCYKFTQKIVLAQYLSITVFAIPYFLTFSLAGSILRSHFSLGLPRSLKVRVVNVAVQFVFIAVALGGLFSSSSWYKWVSIVEICFGIIPVLRKVFEAIRNWEVDLNILITITVIGTLAIQEWIEGAAVVFVFTLAGFLQRYCFYRVQKTISSLMLSKPSNAIMACTGECIPIENVPIGSNYFLLTNLSLGFQLETSRKLYSLLRVIFITFLNTHPGLQKSILLPIL